MSSDHEKPRRSDEPQWDDALERFLSKELDGQLGKSAARWRRHGLEAGYGPVVGSGPLVEPVRRALPLRPVVRIGGWLAAAALAVAAGMALWSLRPAPAIVDRGVRPPDKNLPRAAPSVPAAIEKRLPRPAATEVTASLPQPRLVQQAVRWRTLDEGTVLLDGRAVRKLRRQRLERVEWWDADRGLRMQTLVPREEVVLVAIPTY